MYSIIISFFLYRYLGSFSNVVKKERKLYVRNNFFSINRSRCNFLIHMAQKSRYIQKEFDYPKDPFLLKFQEAEGFGGDAAIRTFFSISRHFGRHLGNLPLWSKTEQFGNRDRRQ